MKFFLETFDFFFFRFIMDSFQIKLNLTSKKNKFLNFGWKIIILAWVNSLSANSTLLDSVSWLSKHLYSSRKVSILIKFQISINLLKFKTPKETETFSWSFCCWACNLSSMSILCSWTGSWYSWSNYFISNRVISSRGQHRIGTVPENFQSPKVESWNPSFRKSESRSRIFQFWVPVPNPGFSDFASRDRDYGIMGTLSRMPTPHCRQSLKFRDKHTALS